MASLLASLRALFTGPRRNDGRPLARFYHADATLLECMSLLECRWPLSPPSMQRPPADARVGRPRHCCAACAVYSGEDAAIWADIMESLCVSHQLLLDTVEAVIGQIADESIRSSRAYQEKFPADVRSSLRHYYAPLWLSAECIYQGSVVNGFPMETGMLRLPAIALCSSIASLRQVLREQACRDPGHYTRTIVSALRNFDRQWCDFEQLYIRLLLPMQTEAQLMAQQSLTVLFSESLGACHGRGGRSRCRRCAAPLTAAPSGARARADAALRDRLVAPEAVETLDPALMFVIPRLAILDAFTRFAGTDLLEGGAETAGLFATATVTEGFREIRAQCAALSDGDIARLRRRLCEVLPAADVVGAAGSVDDAAESERVQGTFRLITSIADELQSGSQVESVRDIMHTVFAMHGACAQVPPASPGRAVDGTGAVQQPERHVVIPIWENDTERASCAACWRVFGMFRRRHHCRRCGRIFCAACVGHFRRLPRLGYDVPVRLCDACYEAEQPHE